MSIPSPNDVPGAVSPETTSPHPYKITDQSAHLRRCPVLLVSYSELTGVITITDLIQIIYASQPFGYDMPTLSGILLTARNNNTRDGITGALVCRRDIYLQLLEGPEAQVLAAYERIGRDDRHVSVRKLVSERMQDRIFGDWAMLHDPEKSLIWTDAEISDGALDRATSQNVKDVFRELAQKVKDVPPA